MHDHCNKVGLPLLYLNILYIKIYIVVKVQTDSLEINTQDVMFSTG